MNPNRARLLIADCHEDTLIVLQKILEDAGFDTTAVWTAEEFLNAIHSRAFDLVLINEYMPGARCDNLLHELRATELRCILMLARKLTASEITALERLGTFEVAEKRNYAEIVHLVNTMLEQEGHTSAA